MVNFYRACLLSLNVRQAQYYFGRSILVWLCSAFFYAVQFIIRVSPNAAVNDMMHDLNIDAYTLGTVVSFYYYGYAFMQIPSGLILDRFGIKRPLLMGCLLCAIGCVMFALSSNIIVLSMARLLMGVGSAFGFISNIKVASLWFPENKMSLVIGLTMTFGTFGAFLAGAPFSVLVNTFGWQYALLFLAAAAFVLAAFVQFAVIEKQKIRQYHRPTAKGLITDIQLIFKNRLTWLLGLYGFLMYLPLAGFADLWGASFLETKYNLSRVDATLVTSWFYIGVGVGAPLWSAVLSYFKDYRPTLLWAAIVTAVLYAMGLHLNFAWLPVLMLTFFVCGMAAGGQFLAFAAIAQINSSNRVGFATGLQNMLCMFSGIIQPIIGYILDWQERGIVQGGIVKTYTIESYEFALGVLTIGLIISCGLYFFIRPIPYAK